MTGPIKYDFAEISNASADIRSTSANINNLLDSLKQQIAPMVVEWEGESSTAYQEAQQKWDRAAEELNTILGTIANTVQQTNDSMSDVNMAAARSWG